MYIIHMHIKGWLCVGCEKWLISNHNYYYAGVKSEYRAQKKL